MTMLEVILFVLSTESVRH